MEALRAWVELCRQDEVRSAEQSCAASAAEALQAKLAVLQPQAQLALPEWSGANLPEQPALVAAKLPAALPGWWSEPESYVAAPQLVAVLKPQAE